MLRYRAVENMPNNTLGVSLKKPEKYSVDEISGSRISQTVDKSSTHVEEGVSRTLEMKPESTTHAMYTHVDFVGPLASRFSKLVNWMLKTNEEHPSIFRRALKSIAGVHPRAELPNYVPKSETFVNKVKNTPVPVNTEGKAYQKRKVLMYTTCLVNYNKPEIGHALRAVLLHNGVEVKAKYPGCCGMPQFEQGKVKETVQQAVKVTEVLSKYIDEGYDVVAPVASCALMLKKEWPLLMPDNPIVQKVAKNTYDASEYIVKVSKEHGLLPINNHTGSVTLHHSCHSRAQSVGFKSQELLQLIPDLKISSIERCSGHGGSFGVDKEGHEIAMKVGKPVFRNAVRNFNERENDSQEHIVASDCPLAVDHIKQGMTNMEPTLPRDKIKTKHPVQILAEAYGLKY
jgi:glycerol-3-phosphate dehydrogenase subunit C